jgi:hypothetical protein
MRFPREMWAGSPIQGAINPPRVVVSNKEEYKNFVRAYNGKMNVYTSVYDFEQFSHNRGLEYSVILDRIFLDFDAHGNENDLPYLYQDVIKMHEWLLEKGYKHTLSFSGRGFHIFVYGIRTHSIRRIKAFFNICNDVLKQSKFLDPVVINNARLRRVQNTYHMGAKCYSIPLIDSDLRKGLPHILELTKKPRSIKQRVYGDKLVEWPDVKQFEMTEVEIDSVESPGNIPILPCLKNAVMVENPNHRARVLLVQWYNELLSELAVLDNGLNCKPREVSGNVLEVIKKQIEDEIKTIASNEDTWIDYNEYETRKHVRFIVDNRYMSPSCNTLIQENLCVGKCWRYTECN